MEQIKEQLTDIKSMNMDELTEFIISLGEKKFRAKQIYEWIHVKHVDSFDEMTNISKKFIQVLKDNAILISLKKEEVQVSKLDGTRKYLFALDDGNVIESVLMKYKHGNSVCISSQVGCRMGCRFCASTLDGLERNLTTSEMLRQIYQIQKMTGERVSNVVVMGTGEPLDNYDNFVNGAEDDPTPNVGVDHPNILAIMNESWADFEDFGNLTLTESPMNYINSVSNAIHGHAYTSVFGAGTSTSEFEFLTGNSMNFLPSGSIPYQQYILGPTDSLATLLKGYGYETRAFHPGEQTSWQRNIAYPRLGFDSFKCGEDMDVPQTEEHGYVSDDSDFEQIIWEFEHKDESTPLFLFNVTIQNHGSYTVEDYPAEVQLADEPGAYPKAEQYLTLANKTDEAFKKLIDYFSAQTEPTILVMFGDHQPSVEQEFLDKAYGVTQDEMTMAQYMDKFKVPFIIWANYPLTGDSTKITSLNFLAQYVLRNAGIETSAYGKYLWNLQKTIPAMTFAGYFDSEGNAYSHLDTTKFTPLIKDYERIQYNNLFGGDERQAELFASPASTTSSDAANAADGD